MIARQRDICLMMGEFCLHPPFKEKGRFLCFMGVCALLWDIWGERNNGVF